MEQMGLLHLYYGDGKGKTTAAMGQMCIRDSRQPAAGAQRPHPPAGVRGRGGIRSGGAAGRVGGIRIGRVGAGGTALAHECGGRLHGDVYKRQSFWWMPLSVPKAVLTRWPLPVWTPAA